MLCNISVSFGKSILHLTCSCSEKREVIMGNMCLSVPHKWLFLPCAKAAINRTLMKLWQNKQKERRTVSFCFPSQPVWFYCVLCTLPFSFLSSFFSFSFFILNIKYYVVSIHSSIGICAFTVAHILMVHCYFVCFLWVYALWRDKAWVLWWIYSKNKHEFHPVVAGKTVWHAE